MSALSSTADLALAPLPQRAGHLLMRDLIDFYMRDYAGKDQSRTQRLALWSARIGDKALQDVSDDDVHAVLEDLARQSSRYFAGKDADGKPIYKAKRKSIAPATVNRYSAALAAAFTWAVRKRIAPRGFVHPCRGVERRVENNERVRYLSNAEREALLVACKASAWPRLYPLVLLALTTGARKSELLGLRWQDLDFTAGTASVGVTKNGDPRVLPLTPTVIQELKPFAAAGTALVFPSPRRADHPCGFEPRWHEALAAAGVKRFRFHDCRHDCASVLARSGASLLEVADVLGHRQLQMTKRYAHLSTSRKSALVNRVMGSTGASAPSAESPAATGSITV